MPTCFPVPPPPLQVGGTTMSSGQSAMTSKVRIEEQGMHVLPAWHHGLEMNLNRVLDNTAEFVGERLTLGHVWEWKCQVGWLLQQNLDCPG